MSSPGNHLYQFESFVLDARSRILLKDGATVRLTPRAFDTLLVLVRCASQLVDKEQLLKEVWPDVFVEEGNLSRNIYELRKSLGDDPAEPRYIETIPKRGYRFIAPVKVSLAEVGPISPSVLDGETTVIEKHTFARVISKDEEETNLPAVSASVLPLAEVTTQAPSSVAARRKQQIKRTAAIVAALLLAAFIGVFLYLNLVRGSQTRETRGKSTLVRLTSNNAHDSAPSWSPDGSKIAFSSNRDGKRQIYVMDADGSNVKRLTNNLTDDEYPRWSPDGRKILFTSNRDGNGEIYVMDADGSNQTRLTRNTADDRAATWSPDGSRIAFSSNRDNSNPYNFDIYVMDANGSNPKRIVDDPEYDADPSWSPDGKKIVFVTGRNGNFDIYEMNADGTEQTNLTAASNKPDIWPTWSPNGNNIAFVRNTEGKEQIFVMEAGGGNLLRVTYNTANNSAPTWSPDGSKLVFPTDRDGNSEIYVMSVEGELTRLTDDPADDLAPDWSSDDSKIVFSSNRDGKQHIYTMNADGSALSQITNSLGDDTDPASSPDGKHIAFMRSLNGKNEMYVMNFDGSKPARISEDQDIHLGPKWTPDGRIVFTSSRDSQKDIYIMDADGSNVTRLSTMGASQAVWSPDGKRVAFVSPGFEKIEGHSWLQLFVMDADGGNVRMITKSPNSKFEPCWSHDGEAIAYTVERMGTMATIFQVDMGSGTDSVGGNVRRLTAGPKFDGRPAYSHDGSKLVFSSNRDGNAEIYVMPLH